MKQLVLSRLSSAFSRLLMSPGSSGIYWQRESTNYARSFRRPFFKCLPMVLVLTALLGVSIPTTLAKNPVDVGSGLKLPSALTNTKQATLKTKLIPKPTNARFSLHTFVLPVHNLTQDTYFSTIQGAVDAATAGNVIQVDAGTYDELVTIPKSLTLQGAGATSILTYTGAAIPITGSPTDVTPTLIKVTAPDVTVQNLALNVDLSKIRSAIHTSGSTPNLSILGNIITPSGTPGNNYGIRNAIAINPNLTNNGYTLVSAGFSGVVVKGNTVNVNASGIANSFRAAVQMDLSGGTIGGSSPADGNTLTSINHDVNVRFANQGAVIIQNNTSLGGGIQFSEPNAGGGPITIANNTLTGATVQPGTGQLGTGALMRLQNNGAGLTVNVTNNTFTTYRWGMSVENFNNVTLSGNSFTPLANSTDYRHISFNTKLLAGTSATITPVSVGATVLNNTFNGSGAAGGTGIVFLNHRQDGSSPLIGTYVLGQAGQENSFNGGIGTFLRLDNSTGPSTGFVSPFGDYTVAGAPSTPMNYWSVDLNAVHNKFDVGTGLKLASALSSGERTTLDGLLFDKNDDANVGRITYFLPVHNLTQGTYFPTIQPAIDAANANDVIELAEYTFAERITVSKSLTLTGTTSLSTVLDGTGLGIGSGITLTNGVTNVTLKKLTVRNFSGNGPNSNAGIYAPGGNSNLTVDDVKLLNNLGSSGLYANGPISNVSITNSTISGHSNVAGAARGLVIWNGFKQNITITGNTISGNNCCGIELQEGTASGVTVTGNTITGNADNGIGLVGLTSGAGPNLIANNILTNNGRFGIEIKLPNGTGLATGDGSIVVENNTVSLTNPITDVRDIAGISVYRRAYIVGNNNVDIPTGVVVRNNTVSGYQQPSDSEGFGIVLEGTNHTVTGNTLTNNDIGVQQQAGNLPYTANTGTDGDQSNKVDTYFGRGNSPATCGNSVTANNFTGNTLDTRNVGPGVGQVGLVRNTSTGNIFCSIQAAVDAASTVNGNTISIGAGTYDELVTIPKSLTLQGAGATSILTYTGAAIPITGSPTDVTPTLIKVTAPDVTVQNLALNVDLSKIRSAIHTSGSTPNLSILGNIITPSGTPGNNYGIRNAIAINPNLTNNGYTLVSAGFSGVVVKGNTVNVNASGIANSFRAAVQMDLSGGTIGGSSPADGNTLTSINHDVNVRFANQGAVIIQNNTSLGGGIQFSEPNAGGGPITIANNTLTGATVQPGTGQLGTGALMRLQNNGAGLTVNVTNNTFTTYRWGMSVENFNNVTLSGNSFTPLANSTDYRHISFNTKLLAGTSATITPVSVGATVLNNTFNGSGAAGGTGIVFLNHRQDGSSPLIGTYVLGQAGQENSFNGGIGTFLRLDNSTGPSTGFVSPFGDYTVAGAPSTPMNYWSVDLNAVHNKFDVGTGLKLASALSSGERTTLDGLLFDKNDDANVGRITYFLPVHNLTQGTYFPTIQPAIDAANANDVIELAEYTFAERITVSKSLTLTGTTSLSTVLDGTGLGIGSGITLTNGVTNVTLKKLTVRNFSGNGPNSNAGIYAPGGNSNLTVDDVKLLNNLGSSGLYANGPISNVSITNSTISGHSNVAGAARGLVIWNGFKQNITITGNTISGNNCCGIELQEGTASGVTVTGNTITGNADNGIGLVGLTSGAGPNLIANNILTNNGRFGIEIKLPNGTGLATGDGSIVVENNTVSLTNPITDVRDIAGISVYRRAYIVGNNNVDIPTGVVVRNNTVSGYQQPSDSEGFGIVLEGTNHTVTGNTLTNNDIGVQQQAGNLPYTANTGTDGDQSNKVDTYFGRGNSPATCGNSVTANNFTGNTLDTRNVGPGVGQVGLVRNTSTGNIFCSIQAAVDAASTVNGNTISIGAGTYDELVTIPKSLTLQGAGATSILTYTGAAIPITGSPTDVTPTLIKVTAPDVTVQNLALNVDLSKIRSAIHTSGSTPNLSILGNIITPSGTPGNNYGIRNAIAINPNLTNNGYTLVSAGFSGVVVKGNTVNVNASGIANSFRAAVQMDLSGGTIGGSSPADGNTLTSINHDVNVRFANQGAVIIQNNTSLGGGIQFSEPNAGGGPITIANNTLTGATVQPGTGQLGTGALMRLQNNGAGLTVNVTNNTFTTYRWGMSVENFNNVTLSGNSFTPLANSTDYRHISFNTKLLAGTSATITPVSVGATVLNNTFNGSGAAGGTGIVFLNHRQDGSSPLIGTYVLGQAGQENSFNGGIGTFLRLDNSTGPSTGFVSPFGDYTVAGAPSTPMNYWSVDLNAVHNKFDVGTGLKLASALSSGERTTLDGLLFDKNDDPNVGRIVYFLDLTLTANPTTFVTTGTTTLTATISGGSAPYSYTFSGPGTITPNGNTALVSGLNVGVQTFTVTASDASAPTGLTVSATVSVTVTPCTLNLSIGASPSLTIPANGSTTLTASGATSYVWSTGATSASIAVNTGGAYSVTGTNGVCSGTASVTLTGADLTPILVLPEANFPAAGSVNNFLVRIFEVNGLPTSMGNVTITITAPAGYTLAFDNTLTSIEVTGVPQNQNPAQVSNANWTVSNQIDNRQISLLIKPGLSIAAGSTMDLGFSITRTSATSGSTANITVNINNDETKAYDGSSANNVYARIISGL